MTYGRHLIKIMKNISTVPALDYFERDRSPEMIYDRGEIPEDYHKKTPAKLNGNYIWHSVS